MVRSNTIQLHVEVGGCDPAGIVFYRAMATIPTLKVHISES